MAGEYFEIGTPPAYGIYARNTRGLTLHNVRLETAEPDLRPAVVFDRVDDASVNGLAAHGHPQSPVVRCVDSKQILLTASRVLTPAAAFLQSEGASQDIIIDGGDLTKAKTPRM